MTQIFIAVLEYFLMRGSSDPLGWRKAEFQKLFK
jgi:hypothetical protein